LAISLLANPFKEKSTKSLLVVCTTGIQYKSMRLWLFDGYIITIISLVNEPLRKQQSSRFIIFIILTFVLYMFSGTTSMF